MNAAKQVTIQSTGMSRRRRRSRMSEPGIAVYARAMRASEMTFSHSTFAGQTSARIHPGTGVSVGSAKAIEAQMAAMQRRMSERFMITLSFLAARQLRHDPPTARASALTTEMAE